MNDQVARNARRERDIYETQAASAIYDLSGQDITAGKAQYAIDLYEDARDQRKLDQGTDRQIRVIDAKNDPLNRRTASNERIETGKTASNERIEMGKIDQADRAGNVIAELKRQELGIRDRGQTRYYDQEAARMNQHGELQHRQMDITSANNADMLSLLREDMQGKRENNQALRDMQMAIVERDLKGSGSNLLGMLFG